VRPGLTRRTVLASGLLAFLIGGVFAVVLQATLDQGDARKLARHSRMEVEEAERLLRLVVDMETGVRGFIITGQERFLAPWNDARTAFSKESRAFAEFVDDPAQAGRARRIVQDGASYIRDYAATLVSARRRHEASARNLAATEEGKRRVDALRDEFGRFTTTEHGTVMVLQNRIDDDAERAALVAAVGLGLSVLLVVLFAAYLARAVVLPVRRVAGMAGQLAGGDLAVRIPESGTGEVGELERAFNKMGSSLEANRDELRVLAEEQAALRRVATLVAQGVPPSEILQAVAAEVSRLLCTDAGAVVLRYEPDGAVAIAALSPPRDGAIGMRWALEGESAVVSAVQTGRGARVDTADRDPSVLSPWLRRWGIRTEVAAPIVVDGQLWGVIGVAWRREEGPSRVESRIAEFTALVATAIANADSRSELTASRARVVATADETRRRIERDLHDGAQQRMVHTIISLKLARRALGDDHGPVAERVDEALEQAERGNAQLRELVRGILPAVLTHGGLRAGVKALASRTPVPVSVDILADRFSSGLEATAYFIVAEALTNVVKHSRAGSARIKAYVDGGALHIEVHDDGVGGAQLAGGSGLLGLQDRAAALGGELRVESPPDGGTVITATLPLG
jgi:signal transduction histidine kinase